MASENLKILGYNLVTIHANHGTLRKREQKGCKKGRKKGVQSGGFTVALFLALFALTLLLYLVNFIATKFIYSLLDPFYTTELKRGKKPGEKRKEWEKGRKKGVKKGGKKATVNDPNNFCFVVTSWDADQLFLVVFSKA
ncbi:hypothetical protein B0H16DRAFT_1693797 [Mycena metata]|uniref:Uncharacterized protein n=1 Tax=Mycena metata TaxID=1033252 RepID=A0AAD7N2Z6_9AGAR|nr:hypothetical protein B0H16DRAFT_1693797 [Mycena metata]